jgi:superfamily II DNA or RNA helicase
MTKENQILIELLNGVVNWAELKVKLEQFNTSQTETTSKKTIAGKIFEVFSKYYFLTDPKQKDLYKTVWLYNDIPSEISKKLSLPPVDHGIDLLLVDHDEKYYAVQCKFTNDETKILSWRGDKIAHVFGLGTLCDKIIVFTNASDTAQVAKDFNEKFIQIAFEELDSIENDVFEFIYEVAKGNQPKELKKYSPEAHQISAINDVTNYLKSNPRTQLILPCGAGKTLTALWIKEKLQSSNTLVLVPSLALLKQIKNDWSRHKNSYFRYICVCSEKDIDKDRNEDKIEVHTYEIGAPVTTKPIDVSRFLSNNFEKVVYCTYQSLEVIKEACSLNPNFTFDLIIFDEAHRTTGSKKKNIFTLAHYDINIPAVKRMYMTATPKVVNIRLKSRLGEEYQDLLCDMSNPEIYGEESHRLSFGDAINQKILVDYKIIGIGVNDKQVKKFIDERNYIGNLTAEDIAHNYALNLVMNKYNASHCLSFHSLVAGARTFAQRHSEMFPDVYSEYVEGNQTTTYRAKVLRRFKNEQKGVVSNARCLTEGVDVPTIDLIYFCDPKSSKIDIVQATGRALRKDRKENKKLRGLIVVPLFHSSDTDIEVEIKKKPIFNYLIQVVRSLCDQDERLEAEINNLSFKKGKKSGSKIEIDFLDSETEKVILLEGLEKRIKDVLFDEIIEKTRNYWDVRFLELKQYIEKFGNSTISKNNLEYKELYHWIGNLRKNYYQNTLDKEKVKRLNEIGFEWKGENRREINDLDFIWKQSYEKLKTYFVELGDSDVPVRYSDKSLGTWCVSQRVKRKEDKLEKWQIELLDKLNFNWKPKNRLDDFLQLLRKYIDENGHTKVVQSETRYGLLPKWVNRYRTVYNTGTRDKNGNIKSAQGSLPAKYIKELDELGFLWYAGTADWNERFEELKDFYHKYGYSNVKQSDNSSLYQWCYKQRSQYESLTDEEISKLRSINFSFELNKNNEFETFTERIESLKKYYNEHKTFDITVNSKETNSLRYWLKRIKKEYNEGALYSEKIKMLHDIGFEIINDKENDNQAWEEKFKQLEEHYESKKTFLISKYDTNQALKSWLIYQRTLFRNGQMPIERIEKFKDIGYSFENKYTGTNKIVTDTFWNQRIEELKTYYTKTGNYYIPVKDKENDSLRIWIQSIKRKFRDRQLTEEQIAELSSLNFDFSQNKKGIRSSEIVGDAWMARLNELKEFYERHMTFYVPRQDESYNTLYNWIITQRALFNKDELANEKVHLMNSIGFSISTNYFPKKEYPKNNLWDENWNLNFQILKDYFESNNTFFIPQTDIVHRATLVWLRNQKHKFNKGILEPDRIEKLKSIGYSFDIKYTGISNLKIKTEKAPKPLIENWNEQYLNLITYKLEKGDTNVPKSSNNKTLANWVFRQRYNFRINKLSEEQIKKLNLIGFEWEVNRQADHTDAWQNKYLELKNIFEKNGKCFVSKNDNKSLSSWVLQQRMNKRKNKLSPDKIELLNQVKFEWDPESKGGEPDDDQWFNMLQQLQQYKDKFGDCNVSQLSVDYKKLGRWLNDQRVNNTRNKLLPHRKSLLNDIGVIWNTKEHEWNLKFEMLKVFYNKNGHFNVKQSDLEYSGLYNWLFKIKKTGLTADRKEKFDAIGFNTKEIMTNEKN